MPSKKKSTTTVPGTPADSITSMKYSAKRTNIPPAGLEAQGVLKSAPKIRYEYNPHLPPILRSATKASEEDKLPELLAVARKRALTAEEANLLATALRQHEPWLEWSGKREKPWFEVDPVALHMHERVSTQAILRVLAREDVERNLFADPQQEYAQAVQFYQHDVDWANRMILGDSLQVMASLARREDLAGKVQTIYFDPPYGIKFGSNFQPQLGQRDVKDREQDLTREPEMVKAYRDTWTLGIHSYLAYMRDRLAMARELLSESGALFVQISDENVHRVRSVMDDVFGANNFVCTINLKKKANQKGDRLESITDYILFFAKDLQKLKYRHLFTDLDIEEDGEFSSDLTGGGVFKTQIFDFEYEGQTFKPGTGNSWKTNADGVQRLARAGRIKRSDKQIRYRRLATDFGMSALTNNWEDTGGAADRIYIVQTATKVVERCLLMTTDPGDLVLDPTCGSGTTAYVAEQWGRRWITCDSSRVALALAKHRLMTAEFDFLKLRALDPEDLTRNPHGTWLSDPTGVVNGKATFECKTVPHITLKTIARNSSLDPIFAKHEPILDAKLHDLNAALSTSSAALRERMVRKLVEKHREAGANSITDADKRRWLLPDTEPFLIKPHSAKKPFKSLTTKQAATYRAGIPQINWNAWQVPFDIDPEWPKLLQDRLMDYRTAWRTKMDEINVCIGANAAMEELVDRPEKIKGVVRVSGPFTMEGVIAVEDGPDSPISGRAGELEAFDGDAAVTNAEAHLDKVIRLLKVSGVNFPGNKKMEFSRLDPLTEASLIHAEGEWMNGDKKERRVAVSIGPEVGNVSAMQVEDVIRYANRRGYDDVVFAGFGFDATAQDAIENGSHPKVRLHMALIRPDVAMGDLLKTQPGSQLFTVFSAPRVKGPIHQASDEYTVEIEGMDVYDPVSNTLFPTDKSRIAAWFLDPDYDGRTFCICQAFFPDKTKWDKLANALGDANVIDEGAFDALSGFTSLPFPRPERIGKGERWRIAVKVIDPRGNEGLRVLTTS